MNPLQNQISFKTIIKNKTLDAYVHQSMKEDTKMSTLRDEAQAYEPPQTLNVADLEKISVDVEIKKETAKDSKGDEFTYFYIEQGDKKYRVPSSVLGGLKAILKKMPQVKEFCVMKEGTGMNTKYQVLPWTQQ